ncbi:hypothetical protein DPMN_088594 [Dreissena polymorpha]|uniref:Uncharacterized protein n=1 Tax=Dreissena polymorpha TaxID=45954 RepID=A0A9D4KV56_DREPO|nr:hypothetical protein DPMN_088594 [Dreissena polymorpha]
MILNFSVSYILTSRKFPSAPLDSSFCFAHFVVLTGCSFPVYKCCLLRLSPGSPSFVGYRCLD